MNDEPRMNDKQREALAALCARWGGPESGGVPFDEAHYYASGRSSAYGEGWLFEGWVGGYDFQSTRRTLYVGCLPDGSIHS